MNLRTVATLVLLAAALALNLHSLLPYAAQTGQDFDAIHLYTPLARRWLAEGWPFLLAQESLQAPPFSWLYPALFGADITSIKIANVVLSCLLLAAVFRAAMLCHSLAAGILAAFAFALSPLLRPFLGTANTEPVFLFLMGVWFWALCEWIFRARKAFILVSGLALGLAMLTRASIFYGVVLLALVLALRRDRGSFAIHLIALALPFAFIVKNLLVFGFAFYVTGGGNALYLGTNPATGGYEPPYLGLIYDVGAIARDQSHLTLQAEYLLGGVGRMLLASLDPGLLAAMYAKKLVAFLFITNAETAANLAWLRSWRIATLILSAIGLAAIRHRTLRIVLATLLAYQVAAHIPALYTHRYSVGALDLWLALLSGCGLAWLAARRRPIELAAVAGAMSAAILAGLYFHWKGGLPEPDIRVARHDLIWEARAPIGVTPQAATEVEIRDAPKFHPWYNYVLLMETTVTPAPADASCARVRISYKRTSDADFGPDRSIERTLEPDGNRHEHQFGAIVPLKLNAEGRLRLELACAPGARLAIHRLAVYAPLGAFEYRERFLAGLR